MTNIESQPEYTNHLIHETSPYLRQHAHNPVNWFAWNEQALHKAKDEDKPILLSIGYSACHWCHVMAHESFEDVDTAHVMNDLFINIKVDREERPDLDKIYQFAHQVLTQRGGGWPLTVILTPQDQVPFFAGTYFPKTARQGMPSFTEILQRVEGFYRHRQDDIRDQNSSLIKILNEVTQTKLHVGAIDSTPLDEARHQLEKIFDELYGGFGSAPKFPHPTNIERLLRHWVMTQQSGRADTGALDMAVTTLKAMAQGGIYDQLGSGFCRYSVDQQWIIPHFEKMLYDNGPLLDLYAQAGQATGDVEFSRIALELGEWVMNEMQSSEGGYYSSIDADSEGEEGRFYVWDKKEVQANINEPAYTLIAHRFGLDRAANFEGQWHFYISDTIDNIARRTHFSSQEVEEQINNARQILFRLRDQRVHPGRDEKILTAWNGLMIKGMASAGRRLQRSDFIASAQQAVDFIYSTLWHQHRLLATYKDGKAHLMAYLDDYVFLIDGLLELLQAQWRDQDLAFAIELMDTVLTHFEDNQQGAFFFTADDHESLIQRPKVLMDEAVPAGNGVAAYVLTRLGHLVAEPRYLAAAERTLKAAWSNIVRTPYAHNALLLAAEEYLYPTQIMVLRGEMESLATWLAQCNTRYAPRRFCVAIPNSADNLPAALSGYQSSEEVVAYICEGDKCLEPVHDLNAFKALL